MLLFRYNEFLEMPYYKKSGEYFFLRPVLTKGVLSGVKSYESENKKTCKFL
jgi:hypothetical protein